MILHGTAIHRVGHGRFGLFFTPRAVDPSLPSRLPALPSSVVMPALSIPASLDVGADDLYNCSLMVTLTQVYGSAVPAGPVGLGETGDSH